MVKEVKYRIIKALDNIEIRHYDKFIIAKVDGYGDGGFNLLFDFISGNNSSKSNLEMTSPVISRNIDMTAPVLSEKESIAFVMPEEYTLENTPTPNDKRVRIEEIPERNIAVLKFSGRWTSSNFEEKSEQLLRQLKKLEIQTKGNLFSMRYNGPLTPWFLRRNEVAIEIESA
jgi:hypothetical protein